MFLVHSRAPCRGELPIHPKGENGSVVRGMTRLSQQQLLSLQNCRTTSDNMRIHSLNLNMPLLWHICLRHLGIPVKTISSAFLKGWLEESGANFTLFTPFSSCASFYSQHCLYQVSRFCHLGKFQPLCQVNPFWAKFAILSIVFKTCFT